MDCFGESNPLFDTLYEGVLSRRHLVMAPNSNLIECGNGVEDLDRFSGLFII